MTREMDELEQDIARSRAKLDETIDKLQRRLTVSGVVDDALGVVRETPYAPFYDRALTTIRSNPVPVLLITAGIGLLLQRLNRNTEIPDHTDIEQRPIGADLHPLKGDSP